MYRSPDFQYNLNTSSNNSLNWDKISSLLITVTQFVLQCSSILLCFSGLKKLTPENQYLVHALLDQIMKEQCSYHLLMFLLL